MLPGLREVEAGRFEGLPEAQAASTYFLAPAMWLQGNRNARIPGSIDGNEFDARYDEAVETIYRDTVADPDPNAIAYSHGAAIMMWVAMNVRGVDAASLETTPLQNTGYFVIRGNPADGRHLPDPPDRDRHDGPDRVFSVRLGAHHPRVRPRPSA